jgi:putative ABC transport system permease protein
MINIRRTYTSAIETLNTALTALFANKARSILTMLGVIIGVAAVILLISIGRGVQNYITDQFEALGSNLLFVSPGNRAFGGDPAEAFSRNKLDEKHVRLIERYAADTVQYVTPYIASSGNVTYKTKTFNASFIGSNQDNLKIYNFELDKGRFFTRNEVRSNAKVAVLGPEIENDLFSNRPAIGEKIKIADDTYEIIGTLKPKGQNFDNTVVMPYTTLMDTLSIDKFSSVVVKSKDPTQIDLTMKQVELAVRRDLKEDEFNVLSQEDILSSIQNILGMLTLGLGAIAAISLIVGGIGIMNIMLVSVTERTKEVGLRKALGATPTNIAMQFLIESVLLSIAGGSLGILIGWLGSLAGRAYIRTEVPWWSILLAFSFSTLVGIIFGTWPAIKASKKDPIEALRYE